MNRDFDAYIKGLQEIESSEHTAAMKALCEMNYDVLSFFPAILSGINRVINSGCASPEIIQHIKDKLQALSTCKRNVEILTLENESLLYANSIDELLERRTRVNLPELDIYEKEVSEMIQKNRSQLIIEKEEKKSSELGEQKKREEEEKKRQRALKRKAAAEYAKLPKQYLWLFLRDINAGEYITVFVDGVKKSYYTSYAEHDEVQGYFYNKSIELTNEDHTVSVVFQNDRLKLDIAVPKIDYLKEGPRNTIAYHITSSSWFKKWTQDPSKIDVRVYLNYANEVYGKKIKPQFQIQRF